MAGRLPPGTRLPALCVEWAEVFVQPEHSADRAADGPPLLSPHLAVVRHISDRVSVMYAGRIVESGSRDELFGAPSHPYTRALLAASGETETASGDTEAAYGAEEPMTPGGKPSGCAFRARCPIARERCAGEVPELIERGQGHSLACFFPEDVTST